LFVNIPIHDIGDVTSIKADHIDESNDGKRVYLTGDITTDDILTDPLFGLVVSNAIKFKRVVEKFQGQDKGWANTTSSLNTETFVQKKLKLGAFTLSSGLIDKLPNFQHLPMTLELFEQIPDNLSVQLGGLFCPILQKVSALFFGTFFIFGYLICYLSYYSLTQ